MIYKGKESINKRVRKKGYVIICGKKLDSFFFKSNSNSNSNNKNYGSK